MIELVSSLHLYQPPLYRAKDGSWHGTFRDALKHSPGALHWDPGALLSILDFSYACGDLTPVREIRRRPWLAEIGPDGEPLLREIPPHDTRWATYPEIARRLGDLLADEAERACAGFSEIYVLLSGGLDSRVTAGTLARLRREGRLPVLPVAVTWGLEDARDVVYARELARMLDFEWLHVPMGPEVILSNIDWCAESLANLVLPVHLHRMSWFSGVSPGALVLATSYGDSVGRAEYSAKHLLELETHRPYNLHGLFVPQVYQEGARRILAEVETLHARAPGAPYYVHCEHEMHAFYTRGMLAHAMSSINDFCTVYQMFTDPAVYSFMWSIHPALRFNEIYGELLHQLDPRLARVPWARTNRGMKGTTGRLGKRLRVGFEQYREWIQGPLYQTLLEQINLDRIDALGIFQMDALRAFIREARTAPMEITPNRLSWFASLDRLVRWMDELGVEMVPYQSAQPGAAFPAAAGETVAASLVGVPATGPGAQPRRPGVWRQVRPYLERSYWLRKWLRDARRTWLRARAIRRNPPRLDLLRNQP